MKILKYNLFEARKSVQDELWKKLDNDHGEFFSLFKDSKGEFAKRDIESINKFCKTIVKPIELNLLEDDCFVEFGMGGYPNREYIELYSNPKSVRIYVDDDEYYYVHIDTLGRWTHSYSYYKVDSIEGLLKFLDKVAYADYKRKDPELEGIRKEILDFVKKADKLTLDKIKSFIVN